MHFIVFSEIAFKTGIWKLKMDFSCTILRAPKLMQPTNSVVRASLPISRKRQTKSFVPDCGLSFISLKFCLEFFLDFFRVIRSCDSGEPKNFNWRKLWKKNSHVRWPHYTFLLTIHRKWFVKMIHEKVYRDSWLIITFSLFLKNKFFRI